MNHIPHAAHVRSTITRLSRLPRSPISIITASASGNKLAAVVKRKHQQIATILQELKDDGLEERLQSAAETPIPRPYRLSTLIAETVPTGRPVLAFEIARSPTTITSSPQLAELAARLQVAGADALVVPTDLDDTPEGLGDLFAVCRAASKIPTLQRDWILHPLQVVEAKEAGCAGMIGVVASVTGQRGTPILSSYASNLGLDCPVEIVNMDELRALEPYGVPFFGLNISVGLSVSIAGFGADVAKGLLGELPFGALSLVGVGSVEEARKMREAGADSLLIRRSLVHEWFGRETELVQALREVTCGDD